MTYYEPPDFAYGGNILTLRHNGSNSDANFLGYDIYYKAYGTLDESNSARSTIESATNATSSTPESVLSTMTGLGFTKMYLAASPTVTPTPLLNIVKDGASVYYFYLPNDTDTTNWYYITNSSSTHVELVRSAGGYGYSFNKKYLVGDSDYGTTTKGCGSGDAVYITAFAVAYGYDFAKLSSIHSFPASLYQPIGGSNGFTLP